MITLQPNQPKIYRHELTYFRAIQAGPDFAKDDIITLNEQINQANEKSTNIIWKNKTTGILLQNIPAIGIDVELIENARLKLSSEVLELENNNTLRLKLVPDNANYAQIHIIGGDIIYTLDGKTIPISEKSLLGIRRRDWDTFDLIGRDEILKFQVKPLNLKENLKLYVEYSQIIIDKD